MEYELLAPAGDPEKLKIAVLYGADAVYFGGEDFSLRQGAGNFGIEEMKQGMEHLHERGRKGYLTLNIYPHNEDIPLLEEYLEKIRDIPLDGFLVSDPGAMSLLKKHIPEAVIHLSTQANLTNYETARFWYDQGVRRVVTARELSLAEIKTLRENIPEDMEIEAFAHGAMCMAYSGRCLLSNYMIGRDANRGECAHPCRWKYVLMEEQRPGEYYPIEEDGRGAYIMNAGDLCMIDHLPDMIRAGVTSFKIEGRMKSVFYLATVVGQYRKALDRAVAALNERRLDDLIPNPSYMEELGKASHRLFTTGFYYGKPDATTHNYESSDYVRDYAFLGTVKSYDEKTGRTLVQQRNKMVVGDEIEVFGPKGESFSQVLTGLWDQEGEPLESAPHPKQMVWMELKQPASFGSMIRKVNDPPVY